MIQIRDFEYSPEAQESRKQELEKLMQDQGSLRSSLLQWCYNSYGEVFFSLFFLIFKMIWLMYLSNRWFDLCVLMIEKKEDDLTNVSNTVAYLALYGPHFSKSSNLLFWITIFLVL